MMMMMKNLLYLLQSNVNEGD